MLLETLKQGYVFLATAYMGIVAGVFFEINLLICATFKNRKAVNFITNFFYVIIFSLIFLISLNLSNYGQFRMYIFVVFSLFAYIEHKTIGFLVAKFFKMIYNLLNKFGKSCSKMKFVQRMMKCQKQK